MQARAIKIGLTITILTNVLLCNTSVASNVSDDTKDLKKNKPIVLFYESFLGSDTIPDPTVWELCDYANNAWSQHFKNVQGYENVKVEDGYLKLKASKDAQDYKNGGVRAKLLIPNDSRVEVRAKLTKLARGGFPAIWQMPVDGEQWPRSGEVDIMEWVQSTPNQIYQTVHTHYINGESGTTGATNPNPDKKIDVTEFHVYAAERTTDGVIFYVDGEETWRYYNMYLSDDKLQFPFDKYNFNIILNYSLGGTLNGNTTWAGIIQDEDLPVEMWVDWIKVTLLDK